MLAASAVVPGLVQHTNLTVTALVAVWTFEPLWEALNVMLMVRLLREVSKTPVQVTRRLPFGVPVCFNYNGNEHNQKTNYDIQDQNIDFQFPLLRTR
jgi:hypothetical protein